MKRSTAVGHRRVLEIEEIPESVLGLISFFLGAILFCRSVCQPAQLAEELTIFIVKIQVQDCVVKSHPVFECLVFKWSSNKLHDCHSNIQY